MANTSIRSLPFPAGKCRALPRWDTDTGKSKTRTVPTADFDIEAPTLSELKNLQKGVAKAISTHQDWQKAEARALDEALAQNQG